jgi:hypothetical protein
MDAYHIIYLLKYIRVTITVVSSGRPIKVEMEFNEPLHDVTRGPRPPLSVTQMAAFAQEFPATIRRAMQDLATERDDLRDRLQELEIANRARYVKMTADEVDSLMRDTDAEAKTGGERKPATTPEQLAARLQAIRNAGPRLRSRRDDGNAK